MTLFAGIFSRNRDQPIPDSGCDELRRVISRDDRDKPSVFRDQCCFIVKVDIDAFEGPAFHVADDGSVSVLAGEPFLDHGEDAARQSRTDDLRSLHESWKRSDWHVVSQVRGVFSAAHYQPLEGKLLLISDKLSIRPLYYWADDKFVVFATALRILESLDSIPKSMDLRGVTEMCGLGYPLGSRTPYSGISLLNAAEIIQVNEEKIVRSRYWHWDQIETSRASKTELLNDAHTEFMQAVSRRNNDDKTTIAYLSGGLDSRCTLAALLETGTRVHTFNFALPGTQDYLFGNEFASEAGTIHVAVPKEHGDLTPDYSAIMARAWESSPHRLKQPAERPSLVWSGEGGSVALGHVHLSREIVRLMRDGKTEDAIDAFLLQEQASVTSRLLRPELNDTLANALHIGIHEELDNLHCADPARNFYLFLLLNDQRRKLATHFENIDQHRLEFQLPFFDSEFLTRIVAVPVDGCLRHRFYLDWLKLFAPLVTRVPWQAYPGHEPCPLKAPEHAAYQWDDAFQADQATALKRELLGKAAQMFDAPNFPRKILRKNYLRIATVIYQLGLRDYSYVIQSAWKYYSYWKLCGGN